jgi:peptide/nickel transport system substrate-binding protein
MFAGINCRNGRERSVPEESKITVFHGGEEGLNGPHMSLLYLPLVTTDEKGDVQSCLAERWEHSPDYRDWTLYLRKDVFWHDGVPVTASDIKFTLEFLTKPSVSWEAKIHESMTVLDDFSLHFHLNRPAIIYGWYGWISIYPSHHLIDLDDQNWNTWDFWKQPVGNGPYRYFRHVPKTLVELDANPDYFRGEPRIKRVIFKFGKAGMLNELLSGNVDVIANVNPTNVYMLKDNSDFHTYYQMEHLWINAIYWNQNNPLFKDASIRKALTLSIDRRELAKVINYPDDIPIIDSIFTESQFRKGEMIEPIPYDPAQAQKLLNEAGWLDKSGDGVRERDGKDFHFTAIVESGNVLEQAVVYVQECLRRIGIRMEIQMLEINLAREKLRAGQCDAAFSEFANGIGGTLHGYSKYFGENSPIGYRRQEVHEFINALGSKQVLLDDVLVDKLYLNISPVIKEDLPLTFLFPRVSYYVVKSNIMGLKSPFRGNPIQIMEDLWIEEEK